MLIATVPAVVRGGGGEGRVATIAGEVGGGRGVGGEGVNIQYKTEKRQS